MKNKGLIAAIVTLVLLMAGGLWFLHGKSVSKEKDRERSVGSASENYNKTASTTQYTVGPTTAVQLLATSTNRVWTRIVSTSTAVYLSYSKPTVATGSEPMSSPFVMDLDHMFTGAIWALASATSQVGVTEFSNP